MPIYEYKCKDCNEAFSLLQWGTSKDAACPKCGSKNVKKQLSSFSCSCSPGSGSGSSGGSSGTGFSSSG